MSRRVQELGHGFLPLKSLSALPASPSRNEHKLLLYADVGKKLNEIFFEIQSRTEENPDQGFERLKSYVTIQAQELIGDSFIEFIRMVSHKIKKLIIASSSDHDVLGGILAIDRLLVVGYDVQDNWIYKWQNLLVRALKTAKTPTIIQAAASALGHFTSVFSGTQSRIMTSSVISENLEKLKDPSLPAPQKQNAAIVLLQLIRDYPNLINLDEIEEFIEIMWFPLFDPSPHLRMDVADVLKWCLVFAHQRGLQTMCCDIYAKVRTILAANMKADKGVLDHSLHGPFLVLVSLIQQAPVLLDSKFKEVCTSVLFFKNHKNSLIRRVIIQILPLLAKFKPKLFLLYYFEEANECLSTNIKTERTHVIKAIGDMASNSDLSRAILPSVLASFETITPMFQKPRKVPVNLSVFSFLVQVSSLASTQETVKKHLEKIIGLLCLADFHMPMLQCLKGVVERVPSLKRDIHIFLLQSIDVTLLSGTTGTPLLIEGSPEPPGPATSSLILTALNAINLFAFNMKYLTDIIVFVAKNYLSSPLPQIRRAAILACAQIVPEDENIAKPATQIICTITQSLLAQAMTEIELSVRLDVFHSLQSRFDKYLVRPDFVDMLFLFLSDDSFEAQEQALVVLGRLSTRNPGQIHPRVRRALTEYLHTLQSTEHNQSRESAAKLLGIIFKCFPTLVRPYTESLISSFVETLKKPKGNSAMLSSHCIQAIGNMSLDTNAQMVQHTAELVSLVIQNFQDQTSSYKRIVALSTLGQLIVKTGYTVDPLTRYPPLLDLVLEKIQTSSAQPQQCMLVKLLGVIGAVDPFRYKELHLELLEKDENKGKQHENDSYGIFLKEQDSFFKEFLRGMSRQSEDYYPTVVLDLLMQILKSPYGSGSLQMQVIKDLMTIFKSMDTRCLPYLKHFMNPLIDCMAVNGPNAPQIRELMFQQFGALVTILKHNTAEYLNILIELMEEYWDHTSLQERIISLLEKIAMVTTTEFSRCFTRFIPKILAILTDGPASIIEKVLQALVRFGTTIDPYLHLLVPAIVELFLFPEPNTVALSAMKTIHLLAYSNDMAQYSLHIFRRITQVIISCPSCLNEVISATCSILMLLDDEMARSVFTDMVKSALSRTGIESQTFISFLNSNTKPEKPQLPPLVSSEEEKPLLKPTDVEVLTNVWDTSRIITDSDWAEWMQRVAITLLQQSPAPALQCVSSLAINHTPVALELFNVAFLSCWAILKPNKRLLVVKNITQALSCPSITLAVLHRLLDLAEFMERSEQSLPLDIEKLGMLAQESHAFAKALYFMEKEYLNNNNQNQKQKFDALITINNHLNQLEAAQGLLTLAKDTFQMEIDISWYEKLQQWFLCLQVYEDNQRQNPNDIQTMISRMRCLCNLGQWEALVQLTETAHHRKDLSPNQAEEIAKFSLQSSLNLGKFDQLSKYITLLESNSADAMFYKSVVSIHCQDYPTALNCIAKCRSLIVSELTALIGESYNRAYQVVVRVQQLAELEEIVEYKQDATPGIKSPMGAPKPHHYHLLIMLEKLSGLQKLWQRRLKVVERSVETWQDILSIRALVFRPRADSTSWVKFANMVRRNARFRRATKILIGLINVGEDRKIPLNSRPDVLYAYYKLLWAQADKRQEAFDQLSAWVATFKDPNVQVPKALQAKCYVNLADWQLQLCDNEIDERVLPAMLESCKLARETCPDWHKAWHTWASVNCMALKHYIKTNDNPAKIGAYLLPAINGFIQSMSLSSSVNLQDTLQLLTLWFTYGGKREVEKMVRAGFETIPIDAWLYVLPQIIARLHMGNVRSAIDHLLTLILQIHPQALVFPIALAYKSEIRSRKQAALTVLNNMRQHRPKLVQETMLVSNELIRVSVLWKERWRRGLDEAYHHYYYERNVHGMMIVLIPLHDMVAAGTNASTLSPSEQQFVKAFGKDLEKAWNYCKDYAKTHNESCLYLAWDLYAHIFRILKRQLQHDNEKLYLSVISPELEKIKDLELPLPGTYLRSYQNKTPLVLIQKFGPVFQVISSKQRPRRLTIHGSDNGQYPFLLKGHEDLRQDERAMQLFGLVNNLLLASDVCNKAHLSIQRFSVIPLSSDSGLIEWLPHSDTFHELLKIYRHRHNINLDSELSQIQRFATREEYHQLPILNKLEIYEYALSQTKGDDLKQVLWLNSQSAELWLEKRTTYTRSLAVMSMVGYLLGLGDRHPNNLMFNRNSGKVIHIDFGDCFEVAINRERFAEKVPFRLTRMLVNAMEVSGIEGNFRMTCENVMAVLRENKESIMSVLEAFVYDPLINWSLGSKRPEENEIVSAMGVFNFKPLDVSSSLKPGIPEMGAIASRSSLSNQLSSQSGDLGLRSLDSGSLQNQKALTILTRVSNKLSGADFPNVGAKLEVAAQVDYLIAQARSDVNLCQAYLPWCPYW